MHRNSTLEFPIYFRITELKDLIKRSYLLNPQSVFIHNMIPITQIQRSDREIQ